MSELSGLMGRVNFLDVGARGDLVEPWRGLQDHLSVISFEADEGERLRLIEHFPGREFKGGAVWHSSGVGELRVTSDPSQSSLFNPSQRIREFELKHWIGRRVVDNYSVDLVSLDSVLEGRELDVLKIDTQGSEFEVISGGREIIKSTLPFILAETWTFPVYEGSRGSAEVLGLVEEMGLEIWGVETAAAWRTDPRCEPTFRKSVARERTIGLNVMVGPSLEDLLNLAECKVIARRAFTLSALGFFDVAKRLATEISGRPSTSDLRTDLLAVSLHEFIRKAEWRQAVGVFLPVRLFRKMRGKPLHPRLT